jgi:hypothetical protein
LPFASRFEVKLKEQPLVSIRATTDNSTQLGPQNLLASREERNITVRKSSLIQQGRDDDLRDTTAEQRILDDVATDERSMGFHGTASR